MIIVKPLILYVMMEKKYKLVAWTENITDMQNARLYMIPSLDCEVQAALIADLMAIHKEEYKCHDSISLDLARRAIRAYENMSGYELFTGHTADGIRYLFFAACYCIWAEDYSWSCRNAGLYTHPHPHKELRDEFERLCDKAISLARRHRLEHILQEEKPQSLLSIYRERILWGRRVS